MFRNRRGELATAVVILTAAVSLLIGLTFTPIKKLFGFGGGDAGKNTKQSFTTKTESKPIFVKGADGKEYILEQTKTETRMNDESEQQKMSLLQKLMVLPKLWLILMILGIFFTPVSAVMAFVNGKLKSTAKQIVAGVENGLASVQEKNPEAKETMLTAMSKKYDSKTKALVSKIKAKL